MMPVLMHARARTCSCPSLYLQVTICAKERDQKIRALAKEVELLQELRHPNIVQ